MALLVQGGGMVLVGVAPVFVVALIGMAISGTRPIASLLSGVVAELAGARVATVVLALPALIAAPYIARHLPLSRADADQTSGDGTSVAR